MLQMYNTNRSGTCVAYTLLSECFFFIVVLRSDRFEYRRLTTQLVKHLIRDLGGAGSNPGMVRHVFAYSVTVGTLL